jgi:hypothetical protein
MAYLLDAGLVDAFCVGDRRGEDELAEQVARLLPFGGSLSNPTVGALTCLVRCLGGEARLLPWLGEHPGVPQIVAAVYALVGLLDRIGDDPEVARAPGDARRRAGHHGSGSGRTARRQQPLNARGHPARRDGLATRRTAEAHRIGTRAAGRPGA